MKITSGLILAALVAAPILAQTPPPPTLTVPGPTAPAAAPQAPPTMPPVQADVTPATNKPPAKAKSPAKAPAKKPAATTAKKTATPKKPAASTPNPADELVANEPAVAKQNTVSKVNVRAKANVNSEPLAQLKPGETVMVLEIVKVPRGEPPVWAKIAMPASVHSWINSSFVDANKNVKPAKLNVRSGPGENYSVIGLMHKGDAVKVVTTKGDWTEIEAAPGAFAFVAAHLLTHKAPAAAPPAMNIAANNPPVAAVAPTTETVTPPPTIGQPSPGGQAPTAPLAVSVPPMAQPADDTPPPPRIVQREGLVGGAVSIQAPSHYQLENLENGKVMDYLYSSNTNLVVSRYIGLTVLVSGEEGLDERWPNTPVLTIQRIQQVETAPAQPASEPVVAPRKAGKGM